MCLERAMDQMQWSINARSPHKQLTTDCNVNLFHNDKQTLQTSVYTLGKDGKQVGLHTNTEKTEIMVYGNEATDLELKTNISDQTKETEPKFCYLSSTLTWNNNCSVEINTVHGLQGV